MITRVMALVLLVSMLLCSLTNSLILVRKTRLQALAWWHDCPPLPPADRPSAIGNATLAMALTELTDAGLLSTDQLRDQLFGDAIHARRPWRLAVT